MMALEIPSDLPLPAVCPQCEAPWIGHGVNAEGTEINLLCERWQSFEPELTIEEVLRFQLAVEPDKLLARSVWLVEQNRPLFEDRILPPWMAEVGRTFPFRLQNDPENELTEIYEIVSVDDERVWVRRAR